MYSSILSTDVFDKVVSMKKLLEFLLLLFGGCFSLGFIVSKLEKKKGWVEGHKPYGIYEKHIKRPLDFAFAVSALLLFWPFFLIVALMVDRKSVV